MSHVACFQCGEDGHSKDQCPRRSLKRPYAENKDDKDVDSSRMTAESECRKYITWSVCLEVASVYYLPLLKCHLLSCLVRHPQPLASFTHPRHLLVDVDRFIHTHSVDSVAGIIIANTPQFHDFKSLRHEHL